MWGLRRDEVRPGQPPASSCAWCIGAAPVGRQLPPSPCFPGVDHHWKRVSFSVPVLSPDRVTLRPLCGHSEGWRHGLGLYGGAGAGKAWAQHHRAAARRVSVVPSLSLSLSPFLYSRAAISRDPFYEMLAARKKKVSSTKRH